MKLPNLNPEDVTLLLTVAGATSVVAAGILMWRRNRQIRIIKDLGHGGI